MKVLPSTAPTIRFPWFKEHWKKSELQSSADVYDGTHQTPTYTKSGVPFVSVENIGDLSQTEKFISPDAFIKDFKHKPKAGDILMTRITAGVIGATALVLDDRPLAYYVSLALIRPKEGVLPSFLKHQIEAPSFRRELFQRTIHVAFPRKINLGDIGECPVYSTEFGEQLKVAQFLTAVDLRIAQLSQKKALLEDYKKGVMQQLFTQTLRFKDDHGHEFPDWEHAEFGKIAKRASEKHNPMTSETEYPSVELESLSQGTGQLLELFVSTDQKSIKGKFTKGDVLFGKLRPYLRKWLLATFDGVCSSEIWVLRGCTVTNAYLYHLVQTDEFMKATNVSSGSKMPRADWDHISAVAFSYPASSAEQTKIANFLTAIDRKIEAVAAQITHTQTWKKGLLQQMFV